MTRVLEIVVALIIVFVLIVLVGVVLPSHGHIERSVEVSNPLHQVYDTLNTYRRFPQWTALRQEDSRVATSFSGAESGVGAKVNWTSANPDVGNGSLEIVGSQPDSQIKMAIDNDWKGANKAYTINLVPSQNGKTVTINWAYDVDYGWNLIWRYAGLYINGQPAARIQENLSTVSAMMASFPNVDYKDQKIQVVDVAARPILFVATKAKRTLDDVAEATDTAMKQIADAMKAAGLNAAGPRMTITTNWGEDNYEFSVAVPVDANTITIDKQSYPIEPVAKESASSEGEDTSDGEPPTLTPGQKDPDGFLIVTPNVRATMSYGGKALETDYTGSPAALPLMRLMEKAYAETHGYQYSEFGEGRFWDELTSAPDVAEDQQTFKIYLPILTQ